MSSAGPVPAERVLVSLKLAILRNSFLKDRRLRLGMTAVAILSVGGGAVAAWAFLQDSHRGPVSTLRSLPPGFTVMFLVWVFGPLVLGGVDDTLDPTRLVLLPLTRSEIRRGLLATSLVGFVTVGSVVALLGVVAGYGELRPEGLVVIAACIVQLFFVLVCGRALSVALAFSSRSRKGRDVTVIIASIAGALLWLGTQSLDIVSERTFDSIARLLRWMPSGALAQSIIDVRSGRTVAAGARIAAVGVASLVLLRVWLDGLDRILVQPEAVRVDRVHPRGRPILGRLPRVTGRRPAFVVFVKELRYLARAPQRRAALIVGTIVGAPFALLQVLRLGDARSVAVYGSPIALLFGIGASNNLLGADASALWLEISSGIRMRALLMGKSLAAVPFVVAPVVSAAVMIAAFTGRWWAGVEVVSFALVCWGIPIGIGCVVSVVAPFPQPETANPFANRRPSAGEGCLIGALGVISLFAVVLLLTPVVVSVSATQGSPLVRNLVVLPGSLVYSLAVWFGALGYAARRAQSRESDLLEALGQRRATR